LIGSVPPPYHGSNIYFQTILNSKLNNEFFLIHLDTSDHRDLGNLGKFEFTNIYIALKNILKLLKLLVANSPNLVYISPAASFWPYIRDGLFILITTFFSNAKIVIHLHSGQYFREEFYIKLNFLFRLFIRWTLRRVDTGIVLGEKLRSLFASLLKNIVVIPNGCEFFLSNYSKFIKNPNDEIVVGYLGNFFKSKGILNVIEAAELVLKENRKIKFIFAGSWPQQEVNFKKEIFHFIVECNLIDNIFFVGELIGLDKERFLIDTDIFVFPSLNEGLPLVILEAMAASCPVISTKDVGVISEVVIDGITGILVEKQNPKQIAEAIKKLIEHPELRESMGKAGKDRFDLYYTFDNNISKLIEIFKDTLCEKVISNLT